MKSRATGAVAACGVTIAAGILAVALGGRASSAPETPSYTEAQAWNGRLVYYQNCAECHGGGLEGQFGPALAGGADRVQFETGKYVYGYFSVFMPHGDPGSLSQSDYVDVMAFLYQQHHRPAGSAELTTRAIAGDTRAVGP